MKPMSQQIAPEISEPSRISIGEHVHIVKRGVRGNWTADYSFMNAEGVHQHSRKSLGTRNRQIAEKRARELEVKLGNGEFKQETSDPTIIDKAIDEFITAKKVGHEDQNEMDTFYYDPRKSKEWMERVPFGEPNEQDLNALKGVSKNGEAH